MVSSEILFEKFKNIYIVFGKYIFIIFVWVFGISILFVDYLLAMGLGDYTKKLVLSKGGNKEVYLLMCFVFYIIALGINFSFKWNWSLIDSSVVMKASIMGFFDFLGPIWILASLKYVDSSLSFISIRFTSSVLILFIWIFFLGDRLSLLNYIWFWLWVIAIFLLSWVNFKEKKASIKNELLLL